MKQETTPITQQQQPKPLSEEQIKKDFSVKNTYGDFTKVALYEEVIDPQTGKAQGLVHIMNPYEKNQVVISLATQASRKDVEDLVQKVSPIPEFCRMLCKMAQCYEQGTPLIIEGGTALGKTFMINKFTELLYGKGAKPLDFYCSGQTDVSELMGKWVPNVGASAETQAKWSKFIESEYGQKRSAEIHKAVQESGEALSTEDRSNMYQAQLTRLVRDAGFNDTAQFTFQYGAVPKAFSGEYRDGKFMEREGAEGFILHIQEVGIAKPAVVNCLLRVRGEQGELAETIQLWEDGGRHVHKGPKACIVFSTNSVEGFLDRKPIDPALSRGAEWLRLGAELSGDSIKMIARQIFSYNLGNDQEPKNKHRLLDLRKAPEIAETLTLAMVAIHQTYAKHFNLGDSDDPQKTPVVMDNMSKVSRSLLDYQVKDTQGGVDLAATLEHAITNTYIDRAREEGRADLVKQLDDRLYGETSKAMFEGKNETLADRLNILAKRALAAQSSAKPGSTTTESKAEEVVNQRILEELKKDLEQAIQQLG